MDIIIFGGQSNMQGQTECLSDESIVERAFEYKWLDNCLVPLKNPVGENIRNDGKAGYPVTNKIIEAGLDVWLADHVLAASCFGNTNLVPKFCEAYLQAKKDTEGVVAVHAAKGSTRIIEWLPGTKGYELLISKAKAAIDLVGRKNIDNIYFVWLQGESDALASVRKEEYKAYLRTLKTSLQEDIGVEHFGIIRVGCFTNDERDWEIIRAQSEICEEEKGFVMLTEIAVELNKQAEYMNPDYHGHYSAAGIEKLGNIAGKTLAIIK